MSVLSSKWGGDKELSPHLIARFFPVERSAEGTWAKSGAVTVAAPLNESTSLEIALNWQSAFESAGAESKAPALLSMLQSGALQPILGAVFGREANNDDAGFAASAQRKSNEFLTQFEGRTGITKLNSTQVFSGMPPIKIQLVALFRAWDDPAKEVEEPFAKLMEWALPQELSPDGTLLKSLADMTRGKSGYVEALMPSRAPQVIGFEYKRRVFMPMVIEAIGVPLSSGVDKGGRFVEMAVPMTICSLTALDKTDWANTLKG